MRLPHDLHITLTVLCGVALVAGYVFPYTALPYLSVAFGSYFALGTAYRSLRERSLDVNFLMVFAAAGAVIVGRPLEAAALLFLFSLSNTLEHYTMGKTRSAIESLVKLRPDRALRVRSDGEERVPIEEIEIGDRVKITPHEQVALDGVVVEGETEVDESAMTGESMPVPKSPGARLIGGTQNLGGLVVMTVSAGVADSTLSKIVSLVRDAQENKASGERISTWFGQRYTIFVLVAFAISLVVRTLAGSLWTDALYNSLILLVALSPCALVISTPATTLSALAWAARKGILIRGGRYIELVGMTRALALDKTGTLTIGQPRLVEICVCASETVAVGGRRPTCTDDHACWHGEGELSTESRQLLMAAAAAEQYSTHPIADAVMQAAKRHGLDVPKAQDQATSPGLGVSAIVDEKLTVVGQARYLEQFVPLPADFLAHTESLQRQGYAIALISHGDRLAALGFADAPRPGATSLVTELERTGIKRVVMLTGDTPQTAERIAEATGIHETRAGLLPDQKAAAVRDLVQQERYVAFVGDGINDAPSLAGATVGIAMGGLGSDIALNAADIVLMNDRLERIPQVIRLGQLTNRIVRANLLFAGTVIAGLAVASLFSALPLPLAVIGHEGSTVLVILNGLRLLNGPKMAARTPA